MNRRLRGLARALVVISALVFGASSALAQTPAAGYAVNHWATGMGSTGWFGVGPVGIAADPNNPNDIYVMNYASSLLYKYDAATGGVEGPGRQISTSYALWGSAPAGLAFDKDGRLYVAMQGWGSVAELSTIDGSIIRFLGCSGCASPTGIATDPISGDLFVSNPSWYVPVVRMKTDGTQLGYYGSDAWGLG